MIRVFLTSNKGSGFAAETDALDGETIGAFMVRLDHDPAKYAVQVNREITTPEYALQIGDRINLFPIKIDVA